MLNRKALVAGLFAAFAVSTAAFADGTQRVVFYGGHEPVRMVQIQTVQPTAPYALTGMNTSQTRMETIWIGSRFVGARVVGR
jgi:hypothetical protein